MLTLFRLKFTWNSRWSLRPCTLLCRLFGVEASSSLLFATRESLLVAIGGKVVRRNLSSRIERIGVYHWQRLHQQGDLGDGDWHHLAHLELQQPHCAHHLYLLLPLLEGRACHGAAVDLLPYRKILAVVLHVALLLIIRGGWWWAS